MTHAVGGCGSVADYGLIGDGRSCAVLTRNGAVVFLCWPRFDSDACFAALLGDERHGSWTMAPREPVRERRWRYRPDTAILETEHDTAGGRVRVTDALAWTSEHPVLIRVVEGLEGSVPMRTECRLRFDNGRIKPWMHRGEGGMCAEIGPDRVVLSSPVDLGRENSDATASFTVSRGERLSFALTYSSSFSPMPSPPEPERLLTETESVWREWIGRFDKPCEWSEAVKRSLITLRLLTDRHTGGIVAAATTSLPEQPGGDMNWDYRYCWLRDSTFTLTALLNAGFETEARRWRDWILRAIGGEPAHMQIAYRIDGARRLDEYEASWLPGWQDSRPVRIGNAASNQIQIDVYGELLDSFDVAARAGIERTERIAEVERAIVEHLEGAWDKPGHGIWEGRGEPEQHIYSQAMAWAGINRFLRAHGGDDDASRRFRALEKHIHDTICARGYSRSRGRFVRTYDDEAIDASLLLLPIIGFLPASDPRIASTIGAIERELMEGGLVRRKPAGSGPGEEGAFLACSFWLADCYQLQGRDEDARTMLERIIGLSNDLGLLSEEYHVPSKRLIGNTPQALS
ncbi:MAG: glycoside hydrolase family 15 protein, partial [Acetobacteraceae bacterium]|nr:glycoside hydrolase family 15 protein [Acetobacteraceae bacterium]